MKEVLSPLLKDTPLKGLIGGANPTPDAVKPLVVACAAAFALGWDAKYNPFGIILKFARDLIRVPDKAMTTLDQLKVAKFRQLTSGDAERIASSDGILHCEKQYFFLDRKTLSYR